MRKFRDDCVRLEWVVEQVTNELGAHTLYFAMLDWPQVRYSVISRSQLEQLTVAVLCDLLQEARIGNHRGWVAATAGLFGGFLFDDGKGRQWGARVVPAGDDEHDKPGMEFMGEDGERRFIEREAPKPLDSMTRGEVAHAWSQAQVMLRPLPSAESGPWPAE